jgi:hypothetical protein
LYYPTLVRHFISQLEALDAQITSQVATAGCRHCGGPLHRGDYIRKPRGALIAEVGEGFGRRHSLCCGRRGCRKRALPPSLRFLGRRVYLEAVVVLAIVFVQMLSRVGEVAVATGVPAWTLRRWRTWWQNDFPRLPTWQELRARFIPPPPLESQLPQSLLARLGWHRNGHRADVENRGFDTGGGGLELSGNQATRARGQGAAQVAGDGELGSVGAWPHEPGDRHPATDLPVPGS